DLRTAAAHHTGNRPAYFLWAFRQQDRQQDRYRRSQAQWRISGGTSKGEIFFSASFYPQNTRGRGKSISAPAQYGRLAYFDPAAHGSAVYAAAARKTGRTYLEESQRHRHPSRPAFSGTEEHEQGTYL